MATNFGKLYSIPKIHKQLSDVPGRPVISNCGTPPDKCSEFLDHNLKNVTQKGWSYIKDFRNFIKKVNNLDSIPENAILMTADVVGLYPSISHGLDLRALREALDKRDDVRIIENGSVCA